MFKSKLYNLCLEMFKNKIKKSLIQSLKLFFDIPDKLYLKLIYNILKNIV